MEGGGIRDRKKISLSVIQGMNMKKLITHRIIYHMILLVVIPFDHSDTILMTMVPVSDVYLLSYVLTIICLFADLRVASIIGYMS